MQFRRAAALAATWLLSSSLARQGFAAEGTPSVQLDYEAAAGCPGEDVFANALAARGVRVERAPELPTIRVRLRAEAAGFVGSLTISASSGPWLARDVGARERSPLGSATPSGR